MGRPLDIIEPGRLAELQQLDAAEPGFLAQVIGLFRSIGPARLATIEAALAATDMASARQAAHALRSSAASVGGHALQRTCARLEAAASAGRVVEVEALLEQARGEYQALLAALDQLAGPPSG